MKKSFNDLIESEKRLKNILIEQYNVSMSSSSLNDNTRSAGRKMNSESEENGAISSNHLDDVDREVINCLSVFVIECLILI